jgi:dolichol-phosphate mannosyltransferase
MPRIIREIRDSGWDEHNCEIVVVDDGSVDGTREILNAILPKEKSLRLIFTDQRLGLGKSIYTGIWSSSAPYIAVMDVDGMHNPIYLKRMMQAINSGCDLVVGSRYVAGGRSQGAIYPHLSRIVNFGIQKLMRSKVKDQLCGFFMTEKRLIQEVPVEKFRGFGEYFIGVLSHFEKSDRTIKELATVHEVRTAGVRKSRRLQMLLTYFRYAFSEARDRAN